MKKALAAALLTASIATFSYFSREPLVDLEPFGTNYNLQVLPADPSPFPDIPSWTWMDGLWILSNKKGMITVDSKEYQTYLVVKDKAKTVIFGIMLGSSVSIDGKRLFVNFDEVNRLEAGISMLRGPYVKYLQGKKEILVIR